jgi:hypothetical protein
MTHVTEGDLQAYLDGALDAAARREVSQHLAGCTECVAELEFLRRASAEFALAVALLDSPAVAIPKFEPRRQRAPAWPMRALFGAPGALLRAALVVLMVGGVAWSALPGSQFRVWLSQVWGDGAHQVAGEVGVGQVGPDTEVPPSGVSILPADGEGRVLLQDLAAGSGLRVRVVESERLTVQWSGAGEDPHFRTAPGRIDVVGGGTGIVLVEAPLVGRTIIELEGRVVATVAAGLIESFVGAEREGTELVVMNLDHGG